VELKAQSLKELYEKDFYLWLLDNLRPSKNKEYELLDWEHLQEELEGMGKMPTKNDFPKECPYTFEQLMEYKPWVGLT
jgi:hypothetical protein